MTKMVQFSEEAYRRLKRMKRKGESFSDVVLRLVPKASLRDLAKLKMTPKEIEDQLALIREIDELDQADADSWMRGSA